MSAAGGSRGPRRARVGGGAVTGGVMTQKTERAGGAVKVTLLRSTIGFNREQAAVVRGMGLRRIGHTVELVDSPATRGMIHKVRHLVKAG